MTTNNISFANENSNPNLGYSTQRDTQTVSINSTDGTPRRRYNTYHLHVDIQSDYQPPLKIIHFIYLRSKKNKEHLRRGHQPNYHLLNKCSIDEDFMTDFLIVDFRSVFGVPIKFLENKVARDEKRIRLLSPYKEHLAQAFARFFMRIGLPINIQSFI